MSSGSSGVASGLASQPSCSTPQLEQRSSFPARHLLPPQSRSLTLIREEDFLNSFNGSFSDESDVCGADLLDCSSSAPDPQLVRRIVSQVEFYFSDENLSKDAFLLKHVQNNKMGFVSIKLLTSFKEMKYLTRDWRLTLYALQFSELLEVNKEGTKVRRRVPLSESLRSFSPSKLLLAWELLPIQNNFMETIVSMFSPFGAIVSIRILQPGRKLPSDVRKYTSLFPELLRKRCALVEYDRLGSARRAFEHLGRRSHQCGESIRVVWLCWKVSKKEPQNKREVAKKLGHQWDWKAQAAATIFPDGIGGSVLYRSPESGNAPVSPSLLLNTEPSAPTCPCSTFQPRDFSNTFTRSLLTRKVFPPLGMGLGTGGCHGFRSNTEWPHGCGWGSGVDTWVPRGSRPALHATPPPRNSLAGNRVPEPLGLRGGVLRLPNGPDGTKGFSSSMGRGKLTLQH
ncbi:la-related protein 6-like [Phalacrocorax aristotelis]|uniref:la-related protein 6-like n=1 Tax=Phalacrocorax aristotelis TaxID=126867 RepID=UPI003F4BA154